MSSSRRALAPLLAAVLAACQAAPAPGAACARASDCPAPLRCAFGRCRTACAADRDCPTGASCLLGADLAGTCGLDVDLGCDTGVGRECAAGLVCVADRCLQSCSPTLGCATGSICTLAAAGVSFCAPGSLDAGASDGGGSDGGAIDAGGTCDAIVDLEPLDAGAGPLTYDTDTSTAPSAGDFTFPCVAGASGIVHQRAFRYRMHGDAFLSVTTNVPFTPATFDTVLGVFASCAQAGAPLACNDDDHGTETRAALRTAQPVLAGTEVIVVVGGYDPPSAGEVSSGNVRLVVSEASAVPLGAACDPDGVASGCVSSVCATVSTGAGTCVAPQAEAEPNALGSPPHVDVTSAVVIQGDIDPADDEDCFRFDVPSGGGSVVLDVSDGVGGCPLLDAPMGLRLHADASASIVSETVGMLPGSPCPGIDGTTSGPAHALPMGSYTACVRQPDGQRVYGYALSISVR